MTYWHSCFRDAYIFYTHNFSINKTTFLEKVSYVDVKCISKEIKLHSNVIEAAAMSKLLVMDF